MTVRSFHSACAGLAETLDPPAGAGELELLCCESSVFMRSADIQAEGLDIHTLQQLLDPLGAHHGDELAGVLLVELALLLVADDSALCSSETSPGSTTRRLRIQHALEFAQGDVEEVADCGWAGLEEPDVGTGAGQLDVAEPARAARGRASLDARTYRKSPRCFHFRLYCRTSFPNPGWARKSGAQNSPSRPA